MPKIFHIENIVGTRELRQESERYVVDAVWLDWRAFQSEVGKRA